MRGHVYTNLKKKSNNPAAFTRLKMTFHKPVVLALHLKDGQDMLHVTAPHAERG